MANVLVVDDNSHQHELFRCYALHLGDVFLSHAHSLDEAVERLSNMAVELILLDNRIPPYSDYRETVPQLRSAGYQGKIIVISADINDRVFGAIKKHTVDTVVDKFEFSMTNFSDKLKHFMDAEAPACRAC